MLWTFAVAQPLFDLLKDNPEFFAARGSSGFDIISFSVLLVVLPPAMLLAIELLIGLAGRDGAPGARTWCSSAALVALIAAQALKKSIDTSDTVLIVLSVADRRGGRRCCARAPSRCARSCNVLSPVPLVFLLLFLFSDPISEARLPERGAGAHDRRRVATRRSSWCCSTSCRRTR